MSVDLKAPEAGAQTPLEVLDQLTQPDLVSPSLKALAGITDRDARLLVALSEAVLLTTRQVMEVGPFKGERRARRRMEFLRQRGWVDIAGKGARGRGVPPAWHLTPRGNKAVLMFGEQMPESALAKGTANLRVTLLASDVYSYLRAKSDLTKWTPLPDMGKADAKGLRPWALVQIDSGKDARHVAVEIDRPSRRRADLETLVTRWSAWRKATSGTNAVIYVVADERRAKAVQEVVDAVQIQAGAAKTRWFHATADPRALWTGRGPEAGP